VHLKHLETHQWKNSYGTAVNSILHLFLEMLFRKKRSRFANICLRNLQKCMLQEMWNHFIHKFQQSSHKQFALQFVNISCQTQICQVLVCTSNKSM